MPKFLEYLENTSKKINYINPGIAVKAILGNESCDLDSMVATLTLAYYYSTLEENKNVLVAPIINMTKSLFSIRVENIYILNKYHILLDWLIFRDTIYMETLQNQCKLSVTLVDHHVVSQSDKFLKNSIVEIIDHRPVDLTEVYEESVSKEIEIVGSCCTLIARRMDIIRETSKKVIGMLYDVITFDTIAYKQSAGKVKPLDLEIAEKLEIALNIIPNNTDQRLNRFNEIWTAHRNISQLSSEQLLYKDLKVLGRIYIPGLPMLVKNYLRRADSMQAIELFFKTNNAQAILMMGLDVDNDLVERDLALYTLDETIAKNVKEMLIMKFEVEQEPSTISHVFCFKQKNSALTRKQIIPLLQLSLFNRL